MAKKGAWLDNKTVVVSGASGGIGAGLAEKFIKEHNCYVIGIGRSEEKMKKVVEGLGSYADHFEYRLFDVSVEENWKNFAEELKTSGKVPSLLLNNAGMLPQFKRTDRFTQEEIDTVMGTNFFSVVYGTRYLLPLLLTQDDPGVVNIASASSLMTIAGNSVYAASKSAVRNYTEAFRYEFRGKCYFCDVCPGFIATDIMRYQDASDRTLKLIRMVSSSCEDMVKWIFDGIEKKKPMMTLGPDARFMDTLNRLFPVAGSTIFSTFMKLPHLDLFREVFRD